MRLFINLTPLIPLSIIGRYILSMGGRDFREGLCPSPTYAPPSLEKGRGSGGWVVNNLNYLLRVRLNESFT